MDDPLAELRRILDREPLTELESFEAAIVFVMRMAWDIAIEAAAIRITTQMDWQAEQSRSIAEKCAESILAMKMGV